MAEEQKVLADLKVIYPIEGAKQFAASLKEVDKAIENSENTQGLDKQLSGISKGQLRQRQQMHQTTKTVKSSTQIESAANLRTSGNGA